LTTLYDIDAFMSAWAKKEYSEEWDNDGVMLCKDLDAPAKKILVCLEINEKVATEAKEKGCDLIVTHHPYIFRPLKSICGKDFELAQLLITAGISVFSYHTRLDAAQGGVNDVLADTLCLSDVGPFAGLGRVGSLSHEMDEEEFLFFVKQKLSCHTLRHSRLCGKKIKRVALLGGAGKDFVPDAARIADAYITGDLSHNAYISANEQGLLAVDAGHYHTENPVAKVMAQKLSEKFPELEIIVSDPICPFYTF